MFQDYEQSEMSHVAGLVIPADLAHVFHKIESEYVFKAQNSVKDIVFRIKQEFVRKL